jgi:conjugative relaxase-like TrwC/TraI family protein
VLLVATVTGQRAGYYLDDLGDELGRVAPALAGPAREWVGRASAAFGLSGPVDGPVLQQLLAGHHPTTGRPLLGRHRTVAAFDLTFTAQKSVSLLFALGSAPTSDHVVAAHRAAVSAAVAYVETRALAVRRGSGEDRFSMATDGMLGASFGHCLSRARDPHLHTHVLVANMAHGDDGRWSAVDGRGLFAHARAAGALYDAHVRAELRQRLGAAWSWHEGKGWDLRGSDPMLLAGFSGRAAEIKQALSGRGSSSTKARHVAWAATREPKGPADAALSATWARRARIASGWHLDTDRAVGPERLDEHRFAAQIAESAPSGVCRRDVVAAWSEASARGGFGDDLQRAVEHWAPATNGSIGVAEPRRAPVSCVPAPHLLAALGPRPSGASGQEVWRKAAAAIERYRERWGVRDPSPLGTECEPLARLPHIRLADHLEVARTVDDALVRLGGRPGAGLERTGPVFERR